MRIAVLHEASATPELLRQYSIEALSTLWQRAGHEVIHLFGHRIYVEADVALVHVDLSVVPGSYLSLARRYPVALNARIRDIRKSKISRNQLQKKNNYSGPVIVKSNLNYAGLPEKLAFAKKRHWARWRKRPEYTRFATPLDYPIYASSSEVPNEYWKDPLLIVEKYLPEYEEGFYHVRQSYFLGERHRSWRLRSSQPMIRADSFIDDVEIETPAEIESYRREIGLDYGKIDFVVHEGKSTILDVNKTIGGPPPPVTISHLAAGIESYATFLAS